MAKSTPTKIQTPGVEPLQAEEPQGEQPSVNDDPPPALDDGDELPPDVQRLIDNRVAAALKAERRSQAEARRNPATGRNDLPTQAEALERVKADPKHRAVLSRDGWVTYQAPAKERDDNGFAKA